jgi:Chlorite dismutase
MSERMSPVEGWGVLDLFFRTRAGVDREAVVAAVKAARADGHEVVTVAMLGHKADFGCIAVGPDQWRLRSLQTSLVATGLELSWSYVSLTEVSEYGRGLPEDGRDQRLYPTLPPEGKPAFGFYPMSKRREERSNWYTLSYDERGGLDAWSRRGWPELRRPSHATDHGVDWHRRPRMGGDAVRRAPGRHQGGHLSYAVRAALGALCRERALFHRHRG